MDRVVAMGLYGGFLFGGVREVSLVGVERREEMVVSFKTVVKKGLDGGFLR